MDNAGMDENRLRRLRLRFGIRDLLWAMVVVGLALGWWLEQPSRRPSMAWVVKPLTVKVYYVPDLVPTTPGLKYGAALVQEIKANVTPTEWGGSTKIEAFDTNESLVVWHSAEGIKLVSEYLAAKRAGDPLNRSQSANDRIPAATNTHYPPPRCPQSRGGITDYQQHSRGSCPLFETA